MAKTAHRVRIALLCAATLLAYANSFRCGFADDARSRVLEDPRIRELNGANVGLILTKNYWYPALTSGLYRPATTLSFLFNYAVAGNGSDPLGYHAVNLALQLLNAALAYVLVWRLFGSIDIALGAAALWTLH